MRTEQQRRISSNKLCEIILFLLFPVYYSLTNGRPSHNILSVIFSLLLLLHRASLNFYYATRFCKWREKRRTSAARKKEEHRREEQKKMARKKEEWRRRAGDFSSIRCVAYALGLIPGHSTETNIKLMPWNEIESGKTWDVTIRHPTPPSTASNVS